MLSTLLKSIASAVNRQWPSRREILPIFWCTVALKGGAGRCQFQGIGDVGYAFCKTSNLVSQYASSDLPSLHGLTLVKPLLTQTLVFVKEPCLGGQGFRGHGLTEIECQLVQRFDPTVASKVMIYFIIMFDVYFTLVCPNRGG